MARGDSYQLQGQQGGVVFSPGVSLSGNFRWIQVVADTVFSDVTATNLDFASALIGPTIPAGIGIGGRFTNIGVTSGLVIAYYA
jgi:hypothetical protein